MGLDLIYNANGVIFTHRFSSAEWGAIHALGAHLPKQVDVCFGVEEFGESVPVDTVELRQSLESILCFLETNARLLPATFEFRLERDFLAGGAVGHFSAGGRAGLRLPNDHEHFYEIRAGVNRCTLTKRAVGADGKGIVLEVRDLRNQSELMTASAGRIEIRRQEQKTRLVESLREMVLYASKIADEKLAKTLG